MWKLYTSMNESVCVRSTYASLADSLPEKVYIGLVNYLDYDSEDFGLQKAYRAFVHKRMAFAHENEARAVLVDAHEDRHVDRHTLETTVNQEDSYHGNQNHRSGAWLFFADGSCWANVIRAG
jgi:hypothetical protein